MNNEIRIIKFDWEYFTKIFNSLNKKLTMLFYYYVNYDNVSHWERSWLINSYRERDLKTIINLIKFNDNKVDVFTWIKDSKLFIKIQKYLLSFSISWNFINKD